MTTTTTKSKQHCDKEEPNRGTFWFPWENVVEAPQIVQEERSTEVPQAQSAESVPKAFDKTEGIQELITLEQKWQSLVIDKNDPNKVAQSEESVGEITQVIQQERFELVD